MSAGDPRQSERGGLRLDNGHGRTLLGGYPMTATRRVDESDLLQLAAAQHGYFSTAQAAAAGISRRCLEHYIIALAPRLRLVERLQGPVVKTGLSVATLNARDRIKSDARH